MRGAYDVLVEGKLVLYVEKGGRSVVTCTEAEGALVASVSALADLVRSGWGRLQVQRIDAEPLGDQPLVTHLRAAGFTDHPRGLVLR